MPWSPNTFAGAGLDRAAWPRGDDAWRADPAARTLLTVDGRLVVDAWGRPLELPLEAVAPADATHAVLLGARDGEPLASVEVAVVPDGARAVSLRELAGTLGRREGGIAAYAVAMGNWHRRHRFCANCGAPTDPGQSGHVRRCPRCGSQHFPRTDPVVIMLVVDPVGDCVLLGRQASWETGRFSCLAGFVEPGETLEEAVVREVSEEAGVEVDEVVFRSSQPWPFPMSLMCGFRCRYAGGDPVARDGELESLRWFRRDELVAAGLPLRHAIARVLIDEWLAG